MKWKRFSKYFFRGGIRLVVREGAIAESSVPVDSAEERAEATGEEKVHEEEAALVVDEGKFEFRTSNGGAPWVFLNMVHGEGANFFSTEQTDRGAEEDTERARANQKKSAEITDWRTAEPHASER